MTKADRQKLERLVGKLRRSHDHLEPLIESKPKAVLRMAEKMRDQLYDVVSAYDAVEKIVASRKKPKAEQCVLLEILDRMSRRYGPMEVGSEERGGRTRAHREG
jgi:hypothetical protein